MAQAPIKRISLAWNSCNSSWEYIPLCDLGMVSPRLLAAPSLSPGATYFPVLEAAAWSTAPAVPAGPAAIKKLQELFLTHQKYKHWSLVWLVILRLITGANERYKGIKDLMVVKYSCSWEGRVKRRPSKWLYTRASLRNGWSPAVCPIGTDRW